MLAPDMPLVAKGRRGKGRRAKRKAQREAAERVERRKQRRDVPQPPKETLPWVR